MKETKYRIPVVAGSFYPSNPADLINQMDSYFEKAPKFDLDGQILGLIAPHAGYIYSGFTASVAYNLLKGKNIKTVVLISPSHREFVHGVSIYDGDGYATPLGNLEVDDELRNELLSFGGPIYKSSDGHRAEHALEVQLPFLQRVLTNFKIVPLVMRNDSFEICKALSENLYTALSKRENYLIVASSDLSHYKNSLVANKLDSVIKEDIDKFDPESIMNDVLHGKAEACGCAPIVSMLEALRKLGANRSKVLHYSDSGDAIKDKTLVVSYLSAVIWKTYS